MKPRVSMLRRQRPPLWKVKAAMAMLKEAEWVSTTPYCPYCPVCGAVQMMGHKVECELALALRLLAQV